ncbi:ankyrin repeat domain-containing protein [Wolbachia endosymbiont (group A) of Myopa testacea]|uniref:ankyrin repeat domain-containing protein n=1 Tax=Wolbachia endosymbiont (group A) of Myopa testacea TaxID=3066148 RepID=UPI003341013D
MNEANGKKIGLHIAAREGLLNIVKYYIKEMGYDVDSKDSHGCTSLFCAVIEREPEVVMHLIEKGADVNDLTQKKWRES